VVVLFEFKVDVVMVLLEGDIDVDIMGLTSGDVDVVAVG
jgi:hypothetical protein